MANIDIYGFDKVNRAYRIRLQKIELLHSSGERMARIMAWNAFVNDQFQMDDGNSAVDRVAKIKYLESLELNDGSIGIDDIDFVRYFYDETCIINKMVPSKKVQLVFYIFLAAAIYGIYSFFK